MYLGAAFSICPTLSFPHCAHKSILYIWISIPSLQIGSSVPFFWIPCICVNIWYLFFSFWLASLSITGSRFIHLNRTNSNSFFFMVSNIPLYHTFFIHSSVESRPSCFHVLAIVNDAAVSTGVCLPFSVNLRLLVFLFPSRVLLLFFPLSVLLMARCSLFLKAPCDQVTSQMCSETSRTTCLSGWDLSPPIIRAQPTFPSCVLCSHSHILWHRWTGCPAVSQVSTISSGQKKMKVKSLSRVRLCDPMNCSLPGSSVHDKDLVLLDLVAWDQAQVLLYHHCVVPVRWKSK